MAYLTALKRTATEEWVVPDWVTVGLHGAEKRLAREPETGQFCMGRYAGFAIWRWAAKWAKKSNRFRSTLGPFTLIRRTLHVRRWSLQPRDATASGRSANDTACLRGSVVVRLFQHFSIGNDEQFVLDSFCAGASSDDRDGTGMGWRLVDARTQPQPTV